MAEPLVSPPALSPRACAGLWIALFAVVGASLAVLYPDSYQQDGGYHYLHARWGWSHPALFVSVWGRPLFTFLYGLPALGGYLAAKLFTVAVCLATAWQTWRLAEELKLERTAWVVPFLFLQPSFLLLCADTMTEPLFGLILVVALRLHGRGRVVAGMAVASLLILVRPEGFFLGLLWGVWVLLDRREGALPYRKRIPATLLLAGGTAAWWLAAWIITGDPLWIVHDWPADWTTEGGRYGMGNLLAYLRLMPQIAGPAIQVLVAVGLGAMLARRQAGTVTSTFVFFLALHSVMWAWALFNAAGYPRYFVCVAPVLAILALAGWNEVGRWMSRLPGAAHPLLGAVVVAGSALFAVWYVDGWVFGRDARAIREVYEEFRATGRPVRRLIWSQAYMCILLDRDIYEGRMATGWHEPFGQPKSNGLYMEKEAAKLNRRILREAPAGTLVFWDGQTGPQWFHLGPADFQAAGFSTAVSRKVTLEGRFFREFRWGHGGPREQEFHLFYKE